MTDPAMPLGLAEAADRRWGAPLAIWRDLAWRGRRPVAVLERLEGGTPTGETEAFPLHPGISVGAQALPEGEPGAGRWCAGHSRGRLDEDGTARFHTVPCPLHRRISRGQQCTECERLDEFRGIHRIHRGGPVTEAARAYALRPHWLYVATFPDGTSKVGTAHERSQSSRLDQQAVAAADYVALAEDGLEVRELEDAVTQVLGLTQAKRVEAKYRAWTAPLPGKDLAQIHDRTVHEAREYLASLDDPLAVDPPRHRESRERWAPSLTMHRAYEALRVEDPRPLVPVQDFGTVPEAFWVSGAVGPFLTAHRGDPDHALLLNTAALKHRTVRLVDEVVARAEQDALF